MQQTVAAEPFGVLVRRYRWRAGLTQEGLAEAAQLSVRAISDIERGVKHVPRKETLALLTEALGIGPEEHDGFEAAARQLRETTRVSATPTNLPAQTTPFIGRERELVAVGQLVQRFPLVTLVGTGGTGKTRLALEVGRRQLDAFPDGVFFVDLAPISRPELVIAGIASALGVVAWRQEGLSEQLEGFLRGKQVLLILDNFEHLLDAGADAAGLVEHHPHLRLLATSRSPLRIYGEQEFPVPPLTLPAGTSSMAVAASEAVRLFVERARLVAPDFALTPDDAHTVATICARLDGLPLAIELAAARTRLFPPAALLRRLDHRLELLAGGQRNLPPRLQSVRAAIDWSYQLLTPDEQRLFARLSVFAGSWTWEAAETIGGEGQLDVLAGISSLVEKSLLRREGADEPRFRLLETVREFAVERLEASGEAEATKARHADYYTSLAEHGAAQLAGPEHALWSARLEQEHDNLRAVLEWYRTTGQFEDGLKLAIALEPFWELRGHLSEGQGWLEDFLAHEQVPSLHCRALYAEGRLAAMRSDYDDAQRLLREALALAREQGDTRATAEILRVMGAAMSGSVDQRLPLFEEARITAQAVGDTELLIVALIYEASLHMWWGQIAPAKSLAEQALSSCRERGDEPGAAVALELLNGIAFREGELERAHALGEESALLLRRAGLGLRFLDITALLVKGARDRGDYQQAQLLVETALEESVAGDYRPYKANMYRLLGLLLREQGDYDRAMQVLEESVAVFREIQDTEQYTMAMVGLSDVARDIGDVESTIAWCEESLAKTGSTNSYGEGFALNNLGLAARQQGDYPRANKLLARALAMGRDFGPGYRGEILASIGQVALDEGEYQRAADAFAESLELSKNSGPAWLVANDLEGMASAAAGKEQPERAAQLFGAATAERERMGAPIWPSKRESYECHVEKARDDLGGERFRTEWEKGHAMREAEAITLALGR